MLVNGMIGLCFILIEIFVHKHTFVRDYSDNNWGNYRKIEFPITYLIGYIILGIIPVINVFVIICLGLIYLIQYVDKDGEFIFSFKDKTGIPCKSKSISKIKEWFKKDINR